MKSKMIYGFVYGLGGLFAAGGGFERIVTNWPWYVTRSSGLLAAVLLLLLVLSGVGLITGYTYKILEPLPAWAAHRALGLSFAVMVLLHITALPFDHFIGFTIPDLLVPFSSQYKPLTIGGIHIGSLYVALGIFALYGLIIVVVSSLLLINKRPKIWRSLHYFSYAILVAVFFHALFLGTDVKTGMWRGLWILGALAAAVSIGLRLHRARTLNKGGDKH